MNNNTRATSTKMLQNSRRRQGSHRKLAESFLTHLDCSWRRHGRETLERLGSERPEVLFRAMVRLAKVLYHRLPEPPEFDLRRYREDVFQRLEYRTQMRDFRG